MTEPLPESGDDISAAWLAECLPGTAISGLRMERIGEGFGLSSELHRCTWEGGPPGRVVVKLWSTDGPAGEREVDFFQTFGRDPGLRIPLCHFGSIGGGRGALILEDLGDVVQGDCTEQLDFPGAERILECVGGMHRKWAGRPELEKADWLPSVSGLQRDPDWFGDRRTEFLARFGNRLNEAGRSIVDNAEKAEARANEVLAGVPETLLHGDLHLDNIVFEKPSGAPVILDWARCAKGPAALDLARIVFSIAEPGHELRLVGPSEDLRRPIGAALLRLSVTWTLGVVRWKPGTSREETMIHQTISRAQAAVQTWKDLDPALFKF